jgi:hypothetical protein
MKDGRELKKYLEFVIREVKKGRYGIIPSLSHSLIRKCDIYISTDTILLLNQFGFDQQQQIVFFSLSSV